MASSLEERSRSLGSSAEDSSSSLYGTNVYPGRGDDGRLLLEGNHLKGMEGMGGRGEGGEGGEGRIDREIRRRFGYRLSLRIQSASL